MTDIGFPDIRTARPEEAEQLAGTIGLAMVADPSVRWVFRKSRQYLDAVGPATLAFGGRAALAEGTAFVVGDFLGAAIWVPPGVAYDEDAMGAILERHVDADRLATVGALFEEMASYHPREPHWHLTLIGVDPAFHRQGLGGRLLAHSLARIDASGAPAYLEATSAVNRALYERHGFEALAEIVVGSSPPMYPMLRPAAPR